MINDIAKYKKLLADHWLPADIAQYAGFRLRAGYVSVIHYKPDGWHYKYNRRTVTSRIMLDAMYSPRVHSKALVWYAQHPLRPEVPSVYTLDSSEPIVVLDNIIDALVMQHVLTSAGIAAQCIYIPYASKLRHTDLPMGDEHGAQKHVFVTRSTPERIKAMLRGLGGTVNVLRYGKAYGTPVQAVMAGESAADMLDRTVRRATEDRRSASIDKVQDIRAQVLTEISHMHRDVYTTEQILKRMVGAGIPIGKIQLSRLLQDEGYPIRSYQVGVGAIHYRSVRTSRSAVYIAIRDWDYWRNCSREAWISHSEERIVRKKPSGGYQDTLRAARDKASQLSAISR